MKQSVRVDNFITFVAALFLEGYICVGYLSNWKVLEGVIAKFHEKGIAIPSAVMDDLKAARTMIRMIKSCANSEEVIQKLTQYLINVESYLVSEGQKTFSSKQIDEWLKQLGEANRKIDDEEEKERFVLGASREQEWVRVKPSAELPINKLKTLIADSALSYKIQADGSLLAYGEHDQIKTFIKKMTMRHKSSTEVCKEGYCR